MEAPSKERMREAAATASKVAGALPDMVFTLSRDGTYTGFLPGGEVDPVVPPEQFMGKRMHDVLGEELAVRIVGHIEQALKTERPETFEYWLGSNKGERLFEARLTPIGEAEVLAIVRDVTEERPGGREQIELREALLAARSAIELAAGSLVPDSEADMAAARALGLIYKLERPR